MLKTWLLCLSLWISHRYICLILLSDVFPSSSVVWFPKHHFLHEKQRERCLGMFFRGGIHFFLYQVFYFTGLFVCLPQHIFMQLEFAYCDEERPRKAWDLFVSIDQPLCWSDLTYASCYFIVNLPSWGFQSIRELTNTAFERRWQNIKCTHFSSSSFPAVIILEPREAYYWKHPSLENPQLQCDN